jgi:hypothetical protein
MNVMRTFLMLALCALWTFSAAAQTLNFTNDLSLATGPTADRGLLLDRPDTPHFPAGSAIWAVLYVPPAGFTSINDFSGMPQGGGAIRKTVEMANRSGGWDLVSSELLGVAADLGPRKSITISVIPDQPNASQPFNQFLDMVSARKGQSSILMRVKFESGADPAHYTQNGFYLDTADGLGRYGEWLAQRGAASNAANADFEQQHMRARSAFVKNYRSLKSDSKFIADVRRWWSAKGGGAPLQSAKVCSDEFIVMRDSLGFVTEKQLCALVTYKSGGQCFAMMRRFSYRRVGKDSFDSDIVDATYANQSLPADEGEAFAGAHPYQIDCNSAN